MKTKIKLEPPYSKDFKQAYLNINKEPRRVVCLIRFNNTKTSTSYARYLMSCHLGRYLNKIEQVDHIDNNKLNDVIDNLQILSPSENNKKNRFKTMLTLICPICNTVFSREKRQLQNKINHGKKPCCSRKCGGIKSHINGLV